MTIHLRQRPAVAKRRRRVRVLATGILSDWCGFDDLVQDLLKLTTLQPQPKAQSR